MEVGEDGRQHNIFLRYLACDVKPADIKKLLVYFGQRTYSSDSIGVNEENVLKTCIELFKCDYNVAVINNSNSDISMCYPSQIPILLSELPAKSSPLHSLDPEDIRDKMLGSKLARARTRVPVPVILCKGKNICRSGTLSGGIEMYGRKLLACTSLSFDIVYKACINQLYGTDAIEDVNSEAGSDVDDKTVSALIQVVRNFSEEDIFSDVRRKDISLLRALKVGSICDLMVEKKKNKYGMFMTSSEKVDKHRRYAEFNLIAIPYPGCEFFTGFREHSHDATNLRYDWSDDENTAESNIINNIGTTELTINWEDYKSWSLKELTCNYMFYLLKYFEGSTDGILIHCISGWDRTPLFISLLRMLLWADGLIHKKLGVEQILYLTLGYDWFCFGHHLKDRMKKNEEVLLFCFYMLEFFCDYKYSLVIKKSAITSDSSADDTASSSTGGTASSSTGGTASSSTGRAASSSTGSIFGPTGYPLSAATIRWLASRSAGTFARAPAGNSTVTSASLSTAAGPSSATSAGSSSAPVSDSGAHKRHSPTVRGHIAHKRRHQTAESSVDEGFDMCDIGDDRFHQTAESELEAPEAAFAKQRIRCLLGVKKLFYEMYYKTVGTVEYGSLIPPRRSFFNDWARFFKQAAEQ